MASLRISALLMAVAIIAFATTRLTEAQSPQSCASKLVGCADYINSTSPPATCCDPLREAVTNELDCLCKLYENPDLFRQLGINVTQALQLPQHCGISGDISACKQAPGPGSPATPTPPATPGSNGVKIASTGVSSLILLLAPMMFF